MASPSRGAYGFRVQGMGSARHLLVDVPAEWPSLTLRSSLGFDAGLPAGVGENSARLRVHDGVLEIDRRRGEAVFTGRTRPTPDALVHPHLAPVAAIAARW